MENIWRPKNLPNLFRMTKYEIRDIYLNKKLKGLTN